MLGPPLLPGTRVSKYRRMDRCAEHRLRRAVTAIDEVDIANVDQYVVSRQVRNESQDDRGTCHAHVNFDRGTCERAVSSSGALPAEGDAVVPAMGAGTIERTSIAVSARFTVEQTPTSPPLQRSAIPDPKACGHRRKRAFATVRNCAARANVGFVLVCLIVLDSSLASLTRSRLSETPATRRPPCRTRRNTRRSQDPHRCARPYAIVIGSSEPSFVAVLPGSTNAMSAPE